jgi:predicted SnoaL-like aldol condensation-catalyzing enzyme
MEENVKVARRFVEEVFGQNKPELLDELLAPDFVEHAGMVDGSADGLKKGVGFLHTTSPDAQYHFVQSIAQDDLVCVQYRSDGTQTGPMGSLPPTGKRFDIDMVDVFRIDGGKIVEHWTFPDRMGKMEDLGFWPPKPQA